MLTDEDKKRIDDSINRNYEKNNTPSGPFLDIIKNFATAGRIEDISHAMLYYCKLSPQTIPYVTGGLAGILVNKYFPTRKDYDMKRFGDWRLKKPEWAKEIIAAYNKPEDFVKSVDDVIKKANKFKKLSKINLEESK